MCCSGKCCVFVKLETGCYLLSLVSFITSLILMSVPMDYLFYRSRNPDFFKSENTKIDLSKFHSVFWKDLPDSTLIVLDWMTFAIGFYMMTASVFLFVGLAKEKPGCLLYYFVFGIFLTIYCMLSTLLLLLEHLWEMSLITLGVALVYIYILVELHTLYEDMQRGKELAFAPHVRLDEDFAFGDQDQDALIISNA